MSDAAPRPMLDTEAMMKAREGGTFAPITDLSVEEAVREGIFRFAPPLIDRSPHPKMLYLEWRAFQYIFDDIEDPRAFPRLPSEPPADDLAMFCRYIAAAEELAESELLCGSDGVTVRWRAATDDAPESEDVEARWTSKEITRGFAVLLRQFDSKDEPASFQRASGRLRALSAEMIDSHERRRCEQIDAWRRAQGKLHGAELQRLARRKLAPGMEYGNQYPPTYYLKAYNYGELIHWDSGRETLEKWEQDAVQRSMQRMGFLEAATSLAYLYIGFSEVVRAAIPQERLVPTSPA